LDIFRCAMSLEGGKLHPLTKIQLAINIRAINERPDGHQRITSA
jgi:hypothetical protein